MGQSTYQEVGYSEQFTIIRIKGFRGGGGLTLEGGKSTPLYKCLRGRVRYKKGGGGEKI